MVPDSTTVAFDPILTGLVVLSVSEDLPAPLGFLVSGVVLVTRSLLLRATASVPLPFRREVDRTFELLFSAARALWCGGAAVFHRPVRLLPFHTGITTGNYKRQRNQQKIGGLSSDTVTRLTWFCDQINGET